MEEKFDYVKKGYNPAQVNEYINTLEAVIKDYKQKETSIMNALISAQSTADDIIKKAEAKAVKIEKNALHARDEVLAGLKKQMVSLRLFQGEYAALVHKHLQPINDDEISQLTSKINDLHDRITEIK